MFRRDLLSAGQFRFTAAAFGVCIALCAPSLRAAPSLIDSVSFPDTLMVGDRFHLSVTITADPAALIVPPPESEFDPAAVREWNSSKAAGSGADTTRFSYLLTTYTPQLCTIPQLTFLVTTGSVTDTLRTRAILVPIQSAIPAEAIDSTLDIKDLKPQFSAGKPSLWWLWALAALALAAAAGWYAHRRWGGKRKEKPAPPPPPPYDEAMEALRALESMGLVRQGKVKEYVFGLSEILKRYAARRFGVNALEFTTEECVLWLRASALDRAVRNRAEWFFVNSDPVKFARWLPDDATLKRMLEEIRAFLTETRPSPEHVSTATPVASVSPAPAGDTQENSHGA